MMKFVKRSYFKNKISFPVMIFYIICRKMVLVNPFINTPRVMFRMMIGNIIYYTI